MNRAFQKVPLRHHTTAIHTAHSPLPYRSSTRKSYQAFSFTMASSLKPSTIAAITAGTVVTGLLAYAVYFDHKRRNDPEFRKQIKRESKRTQRAAKEQEEAQGQEQKKAINAAVARANEEGFPQDPEEVEAYFMQEVAQGEGMVQKGKWTGHCCWDRSANDSQAQTTSRQLCASTAL
jgi:hypothetical protein